MGKDFISVSSNGLKPSWLETGFQAGCVPFSNKRIHKKVILSANLSPQLLFLNFTSQLNRRCKNLPTCPLITMFFPGIKATHSNKIPQKQKELLRQSYAVAKRRLKRFTWVTPVPVKHPGGKLHQRQTSLGQQQHLFCDLHWRAQWLLDHKMWFAFFVGLPLGRTWIQMFRVSLERNKSSPSLSPARIQKKATTWVPSYR